MKKRRLRRTQSGAIIRTEEILKELRKSVAPADDKESSKE